MTAIEQLPEGQRRQAGFGGGSPWVCGVIRQDHVMGNLVVQVGRVVGEHTVEHVVRVDTGPGVVVEREERREAGTTPAAEPYLSIPLDVARALLDALALHFGGAADSRTLRRDYEAERARVDRLIENLIGPARQVIR